eukprot:TRINITY_DN28152_c0_g1_i1.p1 TRINITY_DN28152_c0_g1~~TRINITY_DN28152_c0_g1_i1.p1  ORF type:complete len:339 (+),score=89.95 TRINITY_DN28152_c0_g1_i1:75-1091(+)
MRIPVWLDCDPGHDDAAAILLAAHSPSVRLLGVSTVSGNQSVDKTTRNAWKMMSLCGTAVAGLPLVRGADRPLIREAKHDPGIHGESGLDGSDELDAYTPADTTPMDRAERRSLLDGLQEVARVIAQEPPGTVDIIATGALTNIALLFRAAPELVGRVRQVVLMGGAMGIGNRHPVAEFNILCDPEAAAIVFDLPVKVVMVPLEVTHTALVTKEVASRIVTDLRRSALSKIIVDLMHFFEVTYLREFGFAAPPLHDPCAVAYAIDPSLFTCKLMRVDVVTADHVCSGQTVCDVWGYSAKPKNVHVATKMDVAKFWDVTIDAFRRCNAVSPVNRPQGKL